MAIGSLYNCAKDYGFLETSADKIAFKRMTVGLDFIQSQYTAPEVIDDPFKHFNDLNDIQGHADKIIHKITTEKQPKMYRRVISDKTLEKELGELSSDLYSIASRVDQCIQAIKLSLRDKKSEEPGRNFEKIETAMISLSKSSEQLKDRSTTMRQLSEMVKERAKTGAREDQDAFIQTAQYHIYPSKVTESTSLLNKRGNK